MALTAYDKLMILAHNKKSREALRRLCEEAKNGKDKSKKKK